MRVVPFIFCIVLLSCEGDDEKAIDLLKKAKIQFVSDSFTFQRLFLAENDLTLNSTWLDFANAMAKRDRNKKYKWASNQGSENGVFLIEFTDEGWGWRWEVTLKEQIVKLINDSDYLQIKYGLTKFGGMEEFQIVRLTSDTLKIINDYNVYSGKYEKLVFYQLRGEVLNKTDKKISSGNIKANVKLVFKDKTINAESNYDSKFLKKLSKTNTWNPNSTREFKIQTKGIDKIYLDYTPEYVIVEVGLNVEDPIGFSFEKNIMEKDIKNRWTNFVERLPDNKVSPLSNKRNKSNGAKSERSVQDTVMEGEMGTVDAKADYNEAVGTLESKEVYKKTPPVKQKR